MITIQPDTALPKTPKIRIYSALLTQNGTTEPTAIILQNTLGFDIQYAYNGVGTYGVEAVDEDLNPVEGFTENKISITIGSTISRTLNIGVRTGISDIFIQTLQFTAGLWPAADDLLVNTPFEIKIYK